VTTARGLEPAMAYYGLLDRTPNGRDESASESLWVRRHDEYETPSTGSPGQPWPCALRLVLDSGDPCCLAALPASAGSGRSSASSEARGAGARWV